MKASRSFLIVAGLAVLIACQSPPPTQRAFVPSGISTRVPPSPLPALLTTPNAGSILPSTEPAPIPVSVSLECSPALISESPPETSSLPRLTSGTWQVWQSAINPLQVYDIASASNTLWIGTQVGVVQFDPRTHDCTFFPQPGWTELVLPIEDGKVLAASAAGLWYFDGLTWQRALDNYFATVAAVHLLGIDASGDLWLSGIIGSDSVSQHYTGHIPPLAVSSGESPHHSTPSGSFDCSRWRMYRSRALAFHSPEECQRIFDSQPSTSRDRPPDTVDADGTLWRAVNGTIDQLDATGQLLQQFAVPRSSRLTPDPQHGVWIATTEGLFFTAGGSVQHVSIGLKEYMLAPTARIIVDTAGTIWAATLFGLQRLDETTHRWRTANADVSLPYDPNDADVGRIQDVASTPDGSLWISKWLGASSLQHYAGGTLTPLAAPADCDSLSEPQVDPTGHLWIANARCGILEFAPDTGQWQRHQPPLSNGGYQLSIGADGSVFAFGSTARLLAYSPEEATWRDLAQLDVKLPYRVSLAADHHGGVWLSVCEFGTIQHYSDGSIQIIELPVPNADCLNVFADQQKRLWVSTYDDLFLYDGASWQLIPSLSLGQIKALTGAPDGRLWFVGDRGIAVYDPQQDTQP